MKKFSDISLATILILGIACQMLLPVIVSAEITNLEEIFSAYAQGGQQTLYETVARIGDLNGDGWQDILMQNPGNTIYSGIDGSVLVIISNGDAYGFTDFDGNGVDDLVVVGGNRIAVYKWVELPIPVTLSLFTAERKDQDVMIHWEVNDFVYDHVEFRVFRDNIEITEALSSVNSLFPSTTTIIPVSSR